MLLANYVIKQNTYTAKYSYNKLKRTRARAYKTF